MKLSEFSKLLAHIQHSSYPKRGVFVTSVSSKVLTGLMDGVDIHQYELASESMNSESPSHALEKRLNEICADFISCRKEPSVMLIIDASLLISYGLSLSMIYKDVVTPRSLVILCVPSALSDDRLVSLANSVDQDFTVPLKRFKAMLSEPDSIIEE